MNTLAIFRDIDTFIFDVDGVMTNSDLLVTEAGELLRTMHTRDGYAMKMAINNGYKLIIITGGGSKGVTKRLQGLGVEHIYTKVKDKLKVFKQISEELAIDSETVLYMGDDLVDFQVMKVVALPACPADAAPEILEISKYISPTIGGKGCVRDVIEKVMKLHNKWPAQHF